MTDTKIMYLVESKQGLMTGQELLNSKIEDASAPGYQSEFDPAEAERAGAFVEDALSENDALESAMDLTEILESEG